MGNGEWRRNEIGMDGMVYYYYYYEIDESMVVM